MLYTELNRYDELDRTVLGDDDAYKKYFSFLRDVFERVLAAYQLDTEGKHDEVMLLQHFLGRMLNSVNCICLKYLFDKDFKPKIDQSDSSYLNSYEFKTLKDDMKRAAEKIEELRPRDFLLKELVQSLYAQKENVSTTQHELSLRTYYEHLINDEGSFFLPFSKGQLSFLGNEGARYKYLYTFGIYEETLNVPMIFELLYETVESHDTEKGIRNFKTLLEDIYHSCGSYEQLYNIGKYIDRQSDCVYLKSIKRLVLGPLYSKYSKSISDLGNFIQRFDSPDVFALEVQSETLVSNGETGTASRRKKPEQEFVIGKVPEAILRKVTEYRALLFTPHEVGQLLHAETSLQQEVQRFSIVSLQKK